MTLPELRQQLIDEFPGHDVVISMHVHTGIGDPYFNAHFDNDCIVDRSSFEETVAWLRAKARGAAPCNIDIELPEVPA